MAEFCYECFKKTFGVDIPMEKMKMSNYLDLCEGCAQYKQVVLDTKKSFLDNIKEKLFG